MSNSITTGSTVEIDTDEVSTDETGVSVSSSDGGEIIVTSTKTWGRGSGAISTDEVTTVTVES